MREAQRRPFAVLAPHRRRTRRAAPRLGHRGRDRIAAGEEVLEERKIVVAEEELAIDDHRRHAEDAAVDRVLGLLAQQRLRGGLLRGFDQRGAVESRFVRDPRDDGGIADVPALRPHAAQQSADQPLARGGVHRERRDAQREQGIERMERRREQRHAEQHRLAQVVPRHPARLGSHLGGAHLAVRLEQSREEDGHRLDRAAVTLRQRGQLRPGEVDVGGEVVEVEADRGVAHAAILVASRLCCATALKQGESIVRAFALAAALLLVAAPALADVTVEVGHSHFEPATVTIKKGESVTFHNVDEMPGGHTVAAEDGSFQSPPLAKDEDYTHKFESPGTVKLKLIQHPNTTGEVIVE